MDTAPSFRGQAAFAAAITASSPELPDVIRANSPARARSGLAVYRNNVAFSLINAVAARFPAVRRLAGEDSFLPLVAAFVAACPPRSPVLLDYGGGFSSYIRSRGTAACFAYLADIAALEWARARAYHAADARPLAREAFRLLPRRDPTRVHLRLHPSISLVRSRFPIVSVWQQSQTNDESPAWRYCGPETALVARPSLEVEVWRLPPGGAEFVGALAGASLAAAAATASSAAVEFDLATNLALLMQSRIVVALR